ncbi:MAG: hypothetical protein B6U72_02960 [Candidatus Altiarchaeales archaeon ex4484_2]|nr:MAG: hypothetical protein B6U72_02960 [Candidatus Altiarchaeales archaeon ex4484_2]
MTGKRKVDAVMPASSKGDVEEVREAVVGGSARAVSESELAGSEPEPGPEVAPDSREVMAFEDMVDGEFYQVPVAASGAFWKRVAAEVDPVLYPGGLNELLVDALRRVLER